MRRVIPFLFVVFMVSVLLISCGSGKTPGNQPDETQGSGNTTTNNSETKFEQKPIPPENINPRDYVVDYMVKMSQIKWTPKTTIDLSAIQKSLIYTKGKTYYGIIYSTDNVMINYDGFIYYLDENGTFTGPTQKKLVPGNHCSSAIRLAYSQISPTVSFSWTGNMLPNKKTGTIPVGTYKFESNITTTDEIFEQNNLQTMLDSYALLKKGDAILTCWGSTGHARMIVENHVEYFSNGRVNSDKSYVITIEQTSSFDSTSKNKTTWYVNHKYKYVDLLNTKYIPLTIKELAEDYEVTLKGNGLTSAKTITSGYINGSIRSTTVIRSATVKITDTATGTVVAEKTLENKTATLSELTFDKMEMPEIKTLTTGRYFCEISAETPYGSSTVSAYYFSVQ